jgi:hypothetical protein
MTSDRKPAALDPHSCPAAKRMGNGPSAVGTGSAVFTPAREVMPASPEQVLHQIWELQA